QLLFPPESFSIAPTLDWFLPNHEPLPSVAFLHQLFSSSHLREHRPLAFWLFQNCHELLEFAKWPLSPIFALFQNCLSNPAHFFPPWFELVLILRTQILRALFRLQLWLFQPELSRLARSL